MHEKIEGTDKTTHSERRLRAVLASRLSEGVDGRNQTDREIISRLWNVLDEPAQADGPPGDLTKLLKQPDATKVAAVHAYKTPRPTGQHDFASSAIPGAFGCVQAISPGAKLKNP